MSILTIEVDLNADIIDEKVSMQELNDAIAKAVTHSFSGSQPVVVRGEVVGRTLLNPGLLVMSEVYDENHGAHHVNEITDAAWRVFSTQNTEITDPDYGEEEPIQAEEDLDEAVRRLCQRPWALSRDLRP